MQKIVINCCFGGFGLSKAALDEYNKRTGNNISYEYDLARDDPTLVAVVEEFGKDADTNYSNLKVVEVPNGVCWQIEEYDGNEWVAESHRTWR